MAMKILDYIRIVIINAVNFLLYYIYMKLFANWEYFYPYVFILFSVFLFLVIISKPKFIYWIVSYSVIILYAGIILSKEFTGIAFPGLIFMTIIFFEVELVLFSIVRIIKEHKNKKINDLSEKD